MREFGIRTASGRVIVGPGWRSEADVIYSMHAHVDTSRAADHGELVSREDDGPWTPVPRS